jgi:DNA-binding NarL/FixJ family response regulator
LHDQAILVKPRFLRRRDTASTVSNLSDVPSLERALDGREWLDKAVQYADPGPKERRVPELLARNLSNKEIAMAVRIGEETIK